MGRCFANRGVLIPEKATGAIREIPVHGAPGALWVPKGGRRPAGGRNGLDSSHHLGRGTPARRRRAEIHVSAAINSHGKLPQSGATDFQGNAQGIQIPGKYPGEPRIPGNHPRTSPGTWMPRQTPRWISRETQQPGNPTGEFTGESPGEFGRGSRISLFPAILRVGN